VVRADDLHVLRDPLTPKEELRVATFGDELAASLECLSRRLELPVLVVTATLSLAQDGVGEGAFYSVI
jgi:hypothetical protein